MLDDEKLIKEKEPVTLIEQKAESLREHLTSLQNWDTGEGTLEERRATHAQTLIQRQMDENAALAARMQVRLGPVEAASAAAGSPVQEQVPAKKTWKEKQEEKRRLKEAKKANPQAGLESYAIVHAMKDLSDQKENSLKMPGLKEKMNRGVVDGRVLKNFCQGYRTNKKGKPLTREDAKIKEEDERFLEAYSSGDLNQRRPYLDQIVDEMLSIQITDEMLTPDYIVQNIVEMKTMTDKMTYFENIFKDRINQPYFQGLDPLKITLLQTRVLNNYAVLGTLLVHTAAAKGALIDRIQYTDGDLSLYETLAQGGRQVTQDELNKSRAEEKQALWQVVEAEMEAEKPNLIAASNRQKQMAEEMEGLENIRGLNLTAFTTGYSFDEPAKYRSMIENNVEAYGQHIEEVDALYQEFYRGIDAMGDITLETMACQSVIDRRKGSTSPVDQALVRTAVAHIETLSKKLDLMRDQNNALSDAMECLLRGKKLSEAGRRALDRLGFDGASFLQHVDSVDYGYGTGKVEARVGGTKKVYQNSASYALAQMVQTARETGNDEALQEPATRAAVIQDFKTNFGKDIAEHDNESFSSMTSHVLRGNSVGALTTMNETIKANLGDLPARLIQLGEGQETVSQELVDQALDLILDYLRDSPALRELVQGSKEGLAQSAHFREDPELLSNFTMNNFMLRGVAPIIMAQRPALGHALVRQTNNGTSEACQRFRNSLV